MRFRHIHSKFSKPFVFIKQTYDVKKLILDFNQKTRKIWGARNSITKTFVTRNKTRLSKCNIFCATDISVRMFSANKIGQKPTTEI